jgi:hypothetical protein
MSEVKARDYFRYFDQIVYVINVRRSDKDYLWADVSIYNKTTNKIEFDVNNHFSTNYIQIMSDEEINNFYQDLRNEFENLNDYEQRN